VQEWLKLERMGAFAAAVFERALDVIPPLYEWQVLMRVERQAPDLPDKLMVELRVRNVMGHQSSVTGERIALVNWSAEFIHSAGEPRWERMIGDGIDGLRMELGG